MEESSHFVRSAARKSRITDEWLDIAAKASEDWWKVRSGMFQSSFQYVLFFYFRVKNRRKSVEANHRKFLTALQALRSALQKGNTRKLGVKLDVRLCKEKDGLGFTVTSRDFATAELVESPVYIKNILPVGSAVKDGRLQAGDRLLKINGISVAGMSQAEIVNMLRSVKTGEFVDLVVSRQELSADVGPQLLDVHVSKSATRKKFLQFDVALNETGSAGLGVSVKGRVSTKENGNGPERRDLGIFVKSIMHGGAAFKDGRLQVDDQLVAINDTSLSDYSNLAAIDRLRSAMQAVSPGAKSIRLSVLRDCVPPSTECSKSPGGSTGAHFILLLSFLLSCSEEKSFIGHKKKQRCCCRADLAVFA
ncbi:PDZ domain containing protein [Trichuris trichiura]|uniref:PDZ domain containing protein n=1 Tax=Trichuris trichiura TaxID=36087 RepID=A0A077ZFF6_TRITR|nr:PDZ domain containing protein [Trichuris trichiura]